jgi:hypothetical protein
MGITEHPICIVAKLERADDVYMAYGRHKEWILSTMLSTTERELAGTSVQVQEYDPVLIYVYIYII